MCLFCLYIDILQLYHKIYIMYIYCQNLIFREAKNNDFVMKHTAFCNFALPRTFKLLVSLHNVILV